MLSRFFSVSVLGSQRFAASEAPYSFIPSLSGSKIFFFVRAKEDAAPVQAHGALCSQSPGKNTGAVPFSPGDHVM